MRTRLLRVSVVSSLVVAMLSPGAVSVHTSDATIRLMTVDPGHFHAALVQKEMYPDVSPRAFVFAPLGPDVIGHLQRIERFNARPEDPTNWELDLRTGADFFKRMLKERPGNVVVLSGRNSAKIDRIVESVSAGLHVLADKPWILRSADLPKLDRSLVTADEKGIVAYDIMTERFEITSVLQRELVNDRLVFGEPVQGSIDEPAVYMESVHNLLKVVAGSPNIRPVWFFDTQEQGEGLNDVGTHLVDLVQWTLFPEQGLDRRDVTVIAAQRWPTTIAEPDFRRVTASPGFPPSLASRVTNGVLQYDCNTLVSYALRGIHVKLNVIWDWEAPPGAGDTHYAFYRGGQSRIEVRQTKSDKFLPELYVVPNRPADHARVLAAVRTRVASLQDRFAGVAVEEHGGEIRLVVPAKLRLGHEAHFAEVTRNFLRYVRDPKTIPAWERRNMLTKYYVTTTGTEMSRRGPPRPAPRIAP